MIAPKEFLRIIENNSIGTFCGVPDSLLKEFCSFLLDTIPADRHHITANEGSAIALAAGQYLATGNPSLVYLQNSGIGNTINPLSSLAHKNVYAIPMLLVIGWRGEPSVPDEPQHVTQGALTEAQLELLGIPFAVLPDSIEEAKPILDNLMNTSQREKCPAALLVRANTFAAYPSTTKRPDLTELSKTDAIDAIMKSLAPDAIVVGSTGHISREIYALSLERDDDVTREFLTVGSMGHASQIALGIALKKPEKSVYCLDGDGASLMHLGNSAIIGQSGCSNYRHILLNNAAHDSVGGQPTVGGNIDWRAIATACGYEVSLRASSVEEVNSALEAIGETPGPSMLEVRIKKGARADLPRPKDSPQVNKEKFMSFVSGPSHKSQESKTSKN